jgi:type VI secretion system secreted protein Hcp
MQYRNIFAASLALSLILASAATYGALDASIKVTGSKQGVFKSTSTKHPGTNDFTEITGFNFSQTSPRDAASGLPSGKRTHKPIVITRETDAASPLFWQALSTGELLPAVRLTVYTTVGGKETVDYTVDLTNAKISAATRKNNIDEVSFTYQKITVTWASGKTVTDDWESP